MKRSVLVLCLLTAAASAQIVPMTNDECTTAIVVLDGINPSAPVGLSGNYFTNLGSTPSAGVPAWCVAAGGDVWFSYVATATAATTFSLCTPAGFAAGSNTDTTLQVLDGSICPPTTVLGCDDDTCGAGAAGVPSRVNICTTMGNTYLIRVSAWAGQTNGTFYLSITAAPLPALANDDCSGATALSYGVTPVTNAGGADGCVQSSCGLATSSPGYKDVWFSVVAACTGFLDVSTDCAGADTQLTAYASCGGPEIACNDDDPAGCGFGSRISFFAQQGATYYIRLASWSATAAVTTNITVAAGAMGVQMTSPFGPGSLQVDIGGGPLGGTYFLAVTLAAGSFPNGWFYGLDVTIPELANLINLGFPFVGPLDPTCGSFAIGPIGGVPPITIYSVAFGLPAGVPVPSAITPPLAYTIP